MSYSHLGQAKWVPGQISFSTTPSGRLPDVQRLREAGLPIAPYIEHGSYATGQPAVMRFGLDPYRGLMGPEDGDSTPSDRPPSSTDPSTLIEFQRQGNEAASQVVNALKSAAEPAVLVGVGTVVGLVGGITKRWWLGAILGGVGGYLTSKAIRSISFRY